MSVLYVALLLAAAAVLACRWCAKEGQFDDLVTPAVRILKED